MKQGMKDDGSIADFKRLHGVKVRGGFLPYECHLTRDLNTGQMVLKTGSLSSETPASEKILKWIDEGEVINGRKIHVSSQKIAQWMKIESGTASNYASAMHSSGLIRAKGHGWLLTAKGKKHLEDLTKGVFISAKAAPISGEEEWDF